LAKKPASGGIPANENNNKSRQIEIIGWFFDKPDRS
jgi:hypothetical protein